MSCWPTRFLLSAFLLAALAGIASAQSGSGKGEKKLYRWVDKNGLVHYGDSIPPEFAEQDRDVLNNQGVRIGHEEGIVTPEEARAKAEADKVAREIKERKDRDRYLLRTYQSVEEIQLLRDRRLELISAQLVIQQQSLANLQARFARLEKQASRFQPRSQEPDAQPLPEGLALDLERATSNIATQVQNLAKKRLERDTIRANFEADIQRFGELRSVAPR